MRKLLKIFMFLFFLCAIAIGGVFLLLGREKMLVHLEDIKAYMMENVEFLEVEEKEPEYITLYLKYGGTVVSGPLLSETDTEFTVLWKEQEFVIEKSQVLKVKRKGEAIEWEYNNPMVIKLKNGSVLDACIKDIKKNRAVIESSLDGSSYETEVDINDVEHLVYKPISNKESREIEKKIKKNFPGMKFYGEGNVTIVTDANINWVKECRKNIRVTYTQLYLKFFEVFEGREPSFQNYIVIFDNYEDFVMHAIEDGVPGWAVLGYYHTEEKVTYLFNVLGDNFSKIVYELFIGGTTRSIDAQADMIKNSYRDGHSAIVIDGQAKYIKDKIWQMYNYILSDCRNITITTLRHEFTHALFSNWGIQNVKVSRSEKKRKMSKKREEIFGSGDKEKKKRWIENLVAYVGENEDYDVKASNSWIVEGLATYSETYPVGQQNDRWLYTFQEMIRNDEVYPLEVLTYYKIGSFPGMSAPAMLNAYSQSWAFTTFLMNVYPDEVVLYMKRSCSEGVRSDKEELALFLECLNKTSKEIDTEFVEYIKAKYEPLDDPTVKQLLYIHNLFKEFM